MTERQWIRWCVYLILQNAPVVCWKKSYKRTIHLHSLLFLSFCLCLHGPIFYTNRFLFLITGVRRAFSRVCLFVFLFVRALKRKGQVWPRVIVQSGRLKPFSLTLLGWLFFESVRWTPVSIIWEQLMCKWKVKARPQAVQHQRNEAHLQKQSRYLVQSSRGITKGYLSIW